MHRRGFRKTIAKRVVYERSTSRDWYEIIFDIVAAKQESFTDDGFSIFLHNPLAIAYRFPFYRILGWHREAQ